MIGLAMRAGKVVTGEEIVVKSMKKLKLILLASDAGPNTTKKIETKSNTNNIEVIKVFDREQLSKAIGKNNRVVCGIKDQGFASAIKKLLEEVTA